MPPRQPAEYVPPLAFEMSDVARRLPPPLALGPESTEDGERAFYDTFDRRLRAKGLRLTWEDGSLRLTGEAGRELAVAPWKSPADPLEPRLLPAGALRDAVVPICDVRTLLRSAQFGSERRRTPVLDDEGKTVVRLVRERAQLPGGESLRPRLYLVGVRGYDKALERVRRVLDDLGLQLAAESLEDEAAVLAGGSAPGLPSGADAELTPDMPADRAAVVLCLRQLHSIEANLPGTLADLDSEFLHDLRVAVRRTRSLLRELKTVFPPRDLQRFREEFKWLQQITGPSRDLDVYLLDFGDFTEALPPVHRQDLEVLHEAIADRREAERRAMVAALGSERTTTLIARWAEFLERLPSLPVDERPDAVVPIGELAARRIDRVYRQMVKMGKPIDAYSPPGELHDLRKKGKELRYLLEFFAPLFPRKVIKPMVRTLKALQDVLGRFQDREVQAAMIRALGPDVAERPGGAEALMSMGLLVERLGEQQQTAREEFHACFRAFAAPEQRALVKKTFG